MRPLRSFLVLAAIASLLAIAPPALAAEPKCPLPLDQCLEQYTHMRERPWLGIWFDTDSLTGVRRVRKLVPGAAAERAGLKPGDVLESIGGKAPNEWFAGKAGWKPGDQASIAANRDGREVKLQFTLESISDENLAELLGAHVLAAHMAYGDYGEPHPEAH